MLRLRYTSGAMGEIDKTFYIETFGCQMNVHDSGKSDRDAGSRGISPGRDRGGKPASFVQHLLNPR